MWQPLRCFTVPLQDSMHKKQRDELVHEAAAGILKQQRSKRLRAWNEMCTEDERALMSALEDACTVASLTADMTQVREAALALLQQPEHVYVLALQTALHEAIRACHVELVKQLLESGASATEPPVQDVTGFTPIHYAALYDEPAVVRTLIEHRADPNVTTIDGHLPLHCVVLELKFESLNALVEGGADVDACASSVDQFSALALAVQKVKDCAEESDERASAMRMARALIAFGADVNRRSRSEAPVLLQAAACNSPDTVRLLLAAGADPNLCATDGSTPLLMAVFGVLSAHATPFRHPTQPSPAHAMR